MSICKGCHKNYDPDESCDADNYEVFCSHDCESYWEYMPIKEETYRTFPKNSKT